MANKPNQSIPIILPVHKDRSFIDTMYSTQTQQITAARVQFGTTTDRPNTNLFIGRTFFDTDLNTTVVWNGTTWVTATQSSGIVVNNSFIYGGGNGGISSTSATTDGELLIGATGSSPVSSTLTAGTGIGIVNGPGSITISNGGVTSLIAGNNISLSNATGVITISANSSGAFSPPLTMMYGAFSV